MKDRYNLILKHPLFLEYLSKIGEIERDRLFCKHDLEHLLDVARIAYILTLKKGLPIKKDLIYGAALLHDIGKWREYEEEIPHEVASTELCVEILKNCFYTPGEIKKIQKAIALHRTEHHKKQSSLISVLYKADKASRKCFACQEENNCKWKQKKKNFTVLV